MQPEDSIDNLLAEMFRLSKARFGNAIKGYWFCDEEVCPGCGRPIDLLKVKGQNAISLNTFIYRKTGILIGYLLCKRCAKQIFRAAEKNEYQKPSLHTTIDKNLVAAYQRYLKSLPA